GEQGEPRRAGRQPRAARRARPEEQMNPNVKEPSMLNPRLPLSLIAVAVLAACVAAPIHPTPLEQARASYVKAQTNLQVVQLAPDELLQAGNALAKADAAQKAGESTDRVHQLSCLA